MSDKIEKFSQAIRLGATFRPQCFEMLFLRDQNNRATKTCALGAALEALGHDFIDSVNTHEMIKRFDLGSSCVCPVCGTTKVAVWDAIAHLNDTHRWSRENIADFLETKGL